VPLESPVLDDLTFDELATRLREQIPIHAPEWTNHNESDPGITLIQLFSHLAEQIGYRLNRLPEKNYVEFLKLVGIRLAPAEAATSSIEFVLSKPETAVAFRIPAGAKVKAKLGSKPAFELDEELAGVPAQLAALVTAQSGDLRDLKLAGETGPAVGENPEDYIAERYSLAWDGKTPKLKDMPVAPLGLFQLPSEAGHRHLFIGLAFNPSKAAGFLGQRVSLRLQLDDDEQPDPGAVADANDLGAASVEVASAEDELVEYDYYAAPRAGQTLGSWRPLRLLSDATDGWTRSGVLRFDVPTNMAPIEDAAWQAVETTPEQIPHPLPGALKTPVQGAPSKVPVSGWIHVHFREGTKLRLRALSFNVGSATNAETVRGEIVGFGDGRPGQAFGLAHGNVLAGTLQLAAVDSDDGLLHDWRSVDSFDDAGPLDRVYVLDPEAGSVVFGDGLRGKPPPARAKIVAVRYRHGGGKAGEVDVGLVNQPESLPSLVSDAVNVVAARGGRDAEQLEQAKSRAPGSIKTRDRAVTAEDFEFLALQTRGVRVARAVVVSLRAPLPSSSPAAPGLNVEESAPGVVSVIVVPDVDGLFPLPTEGMLYAVCRQLDAHRLLTTEVYTVSPQYVRLFDIEVEVRAAPGYSRSQLRESIAARLETYFHVLRGGADGRGYPFGTTLHHADLVAQVFRTPGVERVEGAAVWFDGQAPEPADGSAPLTFRPERLPKQRLTNCPETEDDADHIRLLADETVFVDTSTLNVIVR
jgi:hypothetical protein